MGIRELIADVYLPIETRRIQRELKKLPNRKLRELLFALREIVKSPIKYAAWCEELKAGKKVLRLIDVVPALGNLGLVDYWLDDQGDDFMGIEATEAGKAICKKLKEQGYYAKIMQ